MLTPSVYLGADISKLTIDLACPQFAVPTSIPNDPAGYRTLIKLLARHPAPVHVVCEATGPYHREFVAALHQAGILVSVVNPRLPRDFARSRGQLAKTDAIDALLLADYGRTLQPAPTAKPDARMVLLDDLVTRRAQLVEDRAREKIRLEQTTCAEVLASLKRHVRHLDGQIEKLLARIAAVVEATPALRAKVARLVTVQGVGTLTASALLAALPELGTLSKNGVTAPGHFAPFSIATAVPFAAPAPSAAVAGKSAVRCTWRHSAPHAATPSSRRLLIGLCAAKGKAHKVALVAVMRKLLIHLNSLLNSLAFLPGLKTSFKSQLLSLSKDQTPFDTVATHLRYLASARVALSIRGPQLERVSVSGPSTSSG